MRPWRSCSAKCTPRSVGSGTAYSTAVWWDMNWTGSLSAMLIARSSRRLEALDVGQVPDRLAAPPDLHARTGDRVRRGAAVEGVQQRRVGAVETYECPGERLVERVDAQGLRHPGR